MCNQVFGQRGTAGDLHRLLEEGSIDCGGPPDMVAGDGERGFAPEGVATKLGKARIRFQPSAGDGPWQKGRVFRKIKTT